MSILDRFLGDRPDRTTPRRSSGFATGTSPGADLTDEQAVERYRYLLRTAPPETIEEAYAEAFAQLTPEQRRLVLESLNGDVPAQERMDQDDPRSLARLATRAELRRPGTLERSFGGAASGTAALFAANLLSTVAAVVIGTSIANSFDDGSYDDGYQDGSDAANADQGDTGANAGDDVGDTGFDAGGDVGGDFGGDFGGGEF